MNIRKNNMKNNMEDLDNDENKNNLNQNEDINNHSTNKQVLDIHQNQINSSNKLLGKGRFNDDNYRQVSEIAISDDNKNNYINNERKEPIDLNLVSSESKNERNILRKRIKVSTPNNHTIVNNFSSKEELSSNKNNAIKKVNFRDIDSRSIQEENKENVPSSRISNLNNYNNINNDDIVNNIDVINENNINNNKNEFNNNVSITPSKRNNNLNFEAKLSERSNNNEIASSRLKSQKTFKESQEIFINDNEANKNYPTNKIDTSKYSILTFLPKALIFQFYRLANVYFLIIAILQSIPAISPLSSATAIFPIVFVLSVSLIREGIEDYYRHQYDTKTNQHKVFTYKDGKLVASTSESLHVGELIVIKENDIICADVIVIDSTLPAGACYSETATLDGEKTLKSKTAPKELSGSIFDTKNIEQNNNKLKLHNNNNNNNKDQNEENLKSESIQINGLNAPEDLNANGKIICDMPNPNLYSFDGTLELSYIKSTGQINYQPIAVDNSNVLLKGSILKNTPLVIAIVVYSGHNTKLMLNSKASRIKYSELEKLVSKVLFIILGFQFILCTAAAIAYQIFFEANIEDNRYMPEEVYGYPADSVINYFTYLLLLNTMIPISLIITLEIVKIVQGLFISVDCLGYSHVRKEYIKAGSISLNEELGNVNFIFSDKTGTLTCNKMQFKYAIIGDRCYNIEANEDKQINEKEGLLIIESINKNNILMNETVQEYFKLISLAHECAAHEEQGVIEYTGASPDDVELVKTASKFGFACLPSTHPYMKNIKHSSPHRSNTNSSNNELSFDGKNRDFKVEIINEFTSQRKRMSIICFEQPSLSTSNNSSEYEPENYTVYIKGADSEIKKRLKKNLSTQEIDQLSKSTQYISYFAGQGLRILMIAKKTITKLEYQDFIQKLNIANLDLLNKAARVNSVVDEFEQEFDLVGATVVEDKLQDKVPETIMRLKLADIKVWMLTGDSVDTAKKIGLSCNLLNAKEKIFEINGEKGDRLENFFFDFEKYILEANINYNMNKVNKHSSKNVLMDFNNVKANLDNIHINNNKLTVTNNNNENHSQINIKNIKINEINNNSNSQNNPDSSHRFNSSFKKTSNIDKILSDKKFLESPEASFEIVVDRVALYYIFKKASTTRDFLKIASLANSVVCCRVSPMQKAQIVAEMKNFDKKAKTLAIGDGGNDVSMILEANIGIGVFGEEGMRAVQASDYAIGEFKILQRLLFFHGRINLFRISKLIYYFFYKNFFFTIAHFYFCYVCNASGQSIFEDWFITLYNLIYTALPVCVLACSDIDIRPEDGELIEALNPFLYKESRDKPLFTKKGFVMTLGLGLLISLQQFIFILYGLPSDTAMDSDGNTPDLWAFSFIYFTSVFLFATCAIILRISYHTWLFHGFILVLSILPYIISIVIFNSWESANSSGTYTTVLQSSRFWLVLIINVGLGFLVEFSIQAYDFSYSNRITTLLQTQKYNLPSVEEAKSMYPYSKYLAKYKDMVS